MFKNPNYAWMVDYKAPEYAFFGDFYWMYMYNKIFSQGTNEDKYELEEMHANAQTKAPFPFNLLTAITDFSDSYKKVVEMFIYKKVMEHYEDERVRRVNADIDMNSDRLAKMMHDDDIRVYGYDRNEAKKAAKLLEAELEANHTAEQNSFFYDENDETHRIIIRFSCKKYLDANVKVIREEHISVECADGATRKVHAILFDKFHGFYSFAMYSEGNEDNVIQVWNTQFADSSREFYNPITKKTSVTEREGIESKFRFLLDQLCLQTKFNDYREYDMNGNVIVKEVKKAKKQAKEANVNIDKINQALGIMDTNEELNGDIF